MSTRRAPRAIQSAARFTVALVVLLAIFAVPDILIRAGLWWVILPIAATLFVFVVRGRMWRP